MSSNDITRDISCYLIFLGREKFDATCQIFLAYRVRDTLSRKLIVTYGPGHVLVSAGKLFQRFCLHPLTGTFSNSKNSYKSDAFLFKKKIHLESRPHSVTLISVIDDKSSSGLYFQCWKCLVSAWKTLSGRVVRIAKLAVCLVTFGRHANVITEAY